MQQIGGIGVVATQIGSIVGKFDPDLANYVPVITLTLQNISTLCAFFALSKFGRRPCLLVGNLGLGIIDLLIGIIFIFP